MRPRKDLIAALLARPAAARDWRKQTRRAVAVEPTARPEAEEEEALRAPTEDAPAEDLLKYWTTHRWVAPESLTEVLRWRLLEGCEEHPEYLPDLADVLPQTTEAHDRIRAVYDRYEPPPNEEPDWRGGWKKSVHSWLMRHTRHFREELIRKAANIRFTGHHIEWDFDLENLARLDWPEARRIIDRLLAGEEQNLRALALKMLYMRARDIKDSAAAAKWREELKGVAEDRTVHGFARNLAIEELLLGSWPGWDDWYLSLFKDETLLALDISWKPARPLQKPVRHNPERWIPVMTKLVGHENRSIHSHAVNCLGQFHLGETREDALRPILPWLADPGWAKPAYLERLRLIQSLDQVDVPECVPGLIKVAERESDFYLSGAAEALAHYGAKEAVPALKESLGREDERYQRDMVVHAIARLDGFTDDEAVASIKAYATHYTSPEGEQEIEDAITTIIYKKTVLPAVAIGETLCEPDYAREEVAGRLVREAVAMRPANPKAAEFMLNILAEWPVRAADQHFVELIGDGRADCRIILSLLDHRESLPRNADEELCGLLERGGTEGGIAAALLDDPDVVKAILSGTDTEAQCALLACARLARMPLPIAEVGALMDSRVADLALAAEKYLESEDSPEARRLVLARHAGEYKIIGAFEDDDPGWLSYLGFGAAEEHMRREMKRPDGPEEMFALLASSTWGPCEQIFIYKRSADGRLVVYGEDGKAAYRQLTTDELAKLTAFLRTQEVDNLAPYNIEAMDGVEYEYVHLTHAGGRRIYMNNPPGAEYRPAFVVHEGESFNGTAIYGEIVAGFRELAQSGELVLLNP